MSFAACRFCFCEDEPCEGATADGAPHVIQHFFHGVALDSKLLHLLDDRGFGVWLFRSVECEREKRQADNYWYLEPDTILETAMSTMDNAFEVGPSSKLSINEYWWEWVCGGDHDCIWAQAVFRIAAVRFARSKGWHGFVDCGSVAAANCQYGMVGIPKTSGIYFLFDPGSRRIKIGRARDISKRLSQHETHSPIELRFLGWLDVPEFSDLSRIERNVHLHFAENRAKGEWFSASDELYRFASCVRGETWKEVSSLLKG